MNIFSRNFHFSEKGQGRAGNYDNVNLNDQGFDHNQQNICSFDDVCYPLRDVHSGSLLS